MPLQPWLCVATHLSLRALPHASAPALCSRCALVVSPPPLPFGTSPWCPPRLPKVLIRRVCSPRNPGLPAILDTARSSAQLPLFTLFPPPLYVLCGDGTTGVQLGAYAFELDT
ncbi:hypothetical protein VTO73DRAFT_4992 [Trametes versicolor]